MQLIYVYFIRTTSSRKNISTFSTSSFGKIKIHQLNERWFEASLIWPSFYSIQGEDEHLVLNYFILWRYLHRLDPLKSNPTLWTHISQNIDHITREWMTVQSNSLSQPEVQYFTEHMLHVVLDLIWRSNLNITVLRRFQGVLAKAARELEEVHEGGFAKLVFVQEIVKVRFI